MKKYIYKIGLLGMIFFLPQIAFGEGKTLRDVVATVIDYLQVGIYLIIALAVVTFIWNVYRYFFTEKDKKEAGLYVMYSTIGFFVILSFWGLVALLSNSLNLSDSSVRWPFGGSTPQQSPGFNVPPGSNRGSGFSAPPASNVIERI